MKKIFILLGLVTACLGCMGFGYVMGGTNFGVMGYPKFDKYAPSKPFSRDQFSADSYKRQMQEFMDEAKTYMENARNDKKRIDNAIADAIDKNNEAVEDYNRWVRTGY